MISITEETSTSPARATGKKPKTANKARVAPQGAHVAKKKANPAKKPPKSAKEASSAREGSKTNTILDLLKRPGGVTAKELMKATGWQPHSVRGFLCGTIGKKNGPYRHLDQGRGRGTQLLDQSLSQLRNLLSNGKIDLSRTKKLSGRASKMAYSISPERGVWPSFLRSALPPRIP
jgi:hypothetical protein